MNKVDNPVVINKFANKLKKGQTCIQETSFEIIKDENGKYTVKDFITAKQQDVEPALLISLDYTIDDISCLFEENNCDYFGEIDDTNYMGFNLSRKL